MTNCDSIANARTRRLAHGPLMNLLAATLALAAASLPTVSRAQYNFGPLPGLSGGGPGAIGGAGNIHLGTVVVYGQRYGAGFPGMPQLPSFPGSSNIGSGWNLPGGNQSNWPLFSQQTPIAGNEGADRVDVTNPHTCHPVTIGTGNKVLSERDFSGAYEFPLELTRTYNFYEQYPGIFGPSWSSSFDQKLEFLVLGQDGVPPKSCVKLPGIDECFDEDEDVETITAHTGNGALYLFVRGQTSGTYYNLKTDSTSSIIKDGDTWVLTTEDWGKQIYTEAGQILSATDRTGIGWTYEYDTAGYLQRIVHSSGAEVSLTWSGDVVTSVTEPGGETYSYSYTSGRLTGVTYPGGTGSKTYHYEDPNFETALTGVSVDGQRYSVSTYNADGRVVESGLVGGVQKSSFVYDLVFNTRTVTNASGAVSKYFFARNQIGQQFLIKVERSGVTDCPNAVSEVAYDSSGYVDRTTDWNGNTTDYSYNAKGQLTSMKTGIHDDFPGTRERYSTYTWTADNRPRSIKHYGANTSDYIKETIYYYTSAAGSVPGRVARVEEFNRSSHGVANQLRKTAFAYTVHPNKMLKKVTIDGPRTDVTDTTVMEYDSRGFLTKVTNALDHVTTYSNHNGRGQSQLVTDANGLGTEYSYDARGRVTAIKLLTTPARTTSYEYHALGKVKKVTRPDASVLNFSYDSAGYLLRYDQAGQDRAEYGRTILSDVDLIEKKCRTTSGCEVHGTTFKREKEYDELGRIRTDFGFGTDESAVITETRYRYDNNDNLVRLNQFTPVTSLDRNATFEYGPNDDLDKITDEMGNIVRAEYDGGGRIKKVTDAKGVVTDYIHDGFGNRIREQSADIGTRLHEYDAAGNHTKLTRSAGTADQVMVQYQYDALNRLVQASSGSAIDSYSYDLCAFGKGRLCGTSRSANSDSFAFTQTGQLASHVSTIGASTYTVQNQYDALDRLARITYPNGHKAIYEYDNEDQVTTVRVEIGGPAQAVVSGVQHYHYGPLKSYNFGNGEIVNKTYDLNHFLKTIAPSRSYFRNIFDETTGFFDSGGVFTQYGYQKDSRINAVAGTEGSETFTYDGNGNRATHVKSGTTSTYSYVGSSNRIASIAGAQSRTFTYFADGSTKTDTGSRGARSYTYDPVGNWVKSFTVGGVVTQYDANGFGYRVQKQSPALSTDFVVSINGTLLAETGGAAGAMHTNYVWLRGELIAVMKGSNLHFVKSDHIGRPYEARGTDGSVTWRAVGKAFDRAVTFDSIGGLNIGFPGQYFDSESGDWYNVHRYYDPTLGRYTQPDPTGMSDGLNRYSYVGANPVSRIDPDGRVALAIPFIPPIITGTNLAIGTAISLGAYAIDLMLSNSSRPPPGSVPISASPWSGDHGGIKGALGLGGRDSVFIDPEGNVWVEQPDGSWSNEGPASDYTGSGKASGRRGKDRDKRDCP